MISFESSGAFDNTEKYLKSMIEKDIFASLERYGQEGVIALARATPKESSLTANSWSYEILREKDKYSIIWSNSNTVNGTPVAILLQHGHGTGTGGYIQGRDYINPALRPIFDRAVEEAWKVVTAR